MPDLVAPPTVERFRRWGIVAWSLIGLLILTGVALWLLGRIHEVFPPLFVALITIFALNPLVTRLETFGIKRIFGSCLTYLILIAVVAAAVSLLIPVLIDQGREFARDLPYAVDRVGDLATGFARELDDRMGGNLDARGWLGGRSDFVADLVGRAGGFLRGAAQAATLIVIGLVLGFYLLVDLPRLRNSFLKMIPPDRREEAREVAASVGGAMGGFFRGQLVVASIVALMSSAGLALIGLPYWAVVGVIAGFFNLVPLIGPFVGAVPAILIAAALKPPITILWVIVVLIVVQQIDNHFISPNVMRWTVKLHPVTLMITLVAGATLAGLFGMLVAVPIVASIKVIASHFWRTRIPWGEEVFEEEDTGGERGPPHLEAARDKEKPAVLPDAEPERDPTGV